MTSGELSRPVRSRALPGGAVNVDANEAERAALAARFAISGVEAFSARVMLSEADGGIAATGDLTATIVQPCAVTREDFTYSLSEPVNLLFVPAGMATRYAEDEEIELAESAPDEIEYEGESFDLGEALAQTLGLALDPYREGPGANAARKAAGIASDEDPAPTGPLAEALRSLKPG